MIKKDFQGFSPDRSASRSSRAVRLSLFPLSEMNHGDPLIHPDLVP